MAEQEGYTWEQIMQTGLIGHLWSPGIYVSSQMSQEEENILVPTFEIASNPTVRMEEIMARRFYIVDGGLSVAPPIKIKLTFKEVYPDISYRFDILHLEVKYG